MAVQQFFTALGVFPPVGIKPGNNRDPASFFIQYPVKCFPGTEGRHFAFQFWLIVQEFQYCNMRIGRINMLLLIVVSACPVMISL